MEFARIINEEARELVAAGLDVLQLDEPAFNVYMDDVASWGIDALHRAIDGLTLHDRRAHLLWLRDQGQHRLEATLGGEWRQYEKTFPAAGQESDRPDLAGVRQLKVPPSLLGLLPGKDVLVGCIDVASPRGGDAGRGGRDHSASHAARAPERLYPCTNCGMVPLPRAVARGKLHALVAGARIVRGEIGS